MLPVLGGACEEGALKKLIAEELQVSEEQIDVYKRQVIRTDLILCRNAAFRQAHQASLYP